ncbi:MAG: coproporphyrinogen III oxidase [Agrobacterium sp.]|uniref:coproporphyrinogen III oxidase n=1 Tax=Agrobacterium sp. TaxID=361 RepID=UPI004034D1D1
MLPSLPHPLTALCPSADAGHRALCPCCRSKPADEIMSFSEECVNNVVAAYAPLVVKHKDDAFTQQQKEWQGVRRGRYVEFNLVYDRCDPG